MLECLGLKIKVWNGLYSRKTNFCFCYLVDGRHPHDDQVVMPFKDADGRQLSNKETIMVSK